MFGKTLNTWTTYGCDGKSGAPPGLDRQLVMCSHNYFNNSWVNQSTVVNTGDAPEDYTTSVMGNASVRWIKSVLDSGKDHPPFYACTALSGSISTVLTGVSWICVGIHSRRALPCPVCA